MSHRDQTKTCACRLNLATGDATQKYSVDEETVVKKYLQHRTPHEKETAKNNKKYTITNIQ